MAITPDEVIDSSNSLYLSEVSVLENTIDEWISDNYSGEDEGIPILSVDKPRKIVQEAIISAYDEAGWSLSFETTEDSDTMAIVIKIK